jgi:hypothetical protein
MKRLTPSQNVLKKRREAKMKKIDEIGPFVAASLVQIRRKCGNKNCRCAKGEGHPAHILTMTVKGKTKSVYVPVDLVDEVRGWVQNHKLLKKLSREVSNLSLSIIHNHVTKGRGAGKKKNQKSRT